nr:MAG TPA: hypothetical protein [Caudoviricetes sp.]
MIPKNSRVRAERFLWRELSQKLSEYSSYGFVVDKVEPVMIDGKVYGYVVMHTPISSEMKTNYLDEQFLAVPSETNLQKILSNEGLSGIAHLCVKAILTPDTVVGANMLFHTGSNIEFSAPIAGINDKLNISYDIESGILKLSSNNDNINSISIVGYVLE